LVFDLQYLEGIYSFDSGKGREVPGHLKRKKSGITRDGIGTRKDEHITINRLFHPEVYGLPETQDHDGDTDEHGESGHQSGDRNYCPYHGIMKVSTSQFPFDTEKEME
jgi:hypothetical protein